MIAIPIIVPTSKDLKQFSLKKFFKTQMSPNDEIKACKETECLTGGEGLVQLTSLYFLV
jgi:hypothetical protein